MAARCLRAFSTRRLATVWFVVRVKGRSLQCRLADQSPPEPGVAQADTPQGLARERLAGAVGGKAHLAQVHAQHTARHQNLADHGQVKAAVPHKEPGGRFPYRAGEEGKLAISGGEGHFDATAYGGTGRPNRARISR